MLDNRQSCRIGHGPCEKGIAQHR